MRRALQLGRKLSVVSCRLSALTLCALCVLCGECFAQSPETLTLPMERTAAGWLVTVHVCVPEGPDGGGACYPHRLLLDTGATESALDAAYLALPRLKEKTTVHLGSGSEQRAQLAPLYLLLRRPARGWGARVAPLDVDFSHLRALCGNDPERESQGRCDQVAGLVGVNFLEQFAAVTIDFRARTLILSKEPSK